MIADIMASELQESLKDFKIAAAEEVMWARHRGARDYNIVD